MPLLRPRVEEPDRGDVVPIAAEKKGPLAEILKWIPLEVIAFYEAVMAALPAKDYPELRLWVTLAGFFVCGLWIAFATQTKKKKKLAWRQIILSMIAFVFWAVAVQSEVLSNLWGWKPLVCTVVMLFGTVLLRIFDGILTALGVPQSK